jgi:hypothetical protein
MEIQIQTWFPSLTNCWGTSMNSFILSDMVIDVDVERSIILSHVQLFSAKATTDAKREVGAGPV